MLRTLNRQSTTCRKYSELPTNSTLGRSRDRRWAGLLAVSGPFRFVTAYGQDLGSVPLSVLMRGLVWEWRMAVGTRPSQACRDVKIFGPGLHTRLLFR